MTTRVALRVRHPYALRIVKEQNHPLLGAIAIALDVIPTDPEKIHAPDWSLILAGAVFIFGGLAVGFRAHELLVSVLGNLIVAAFAVVAAWVALAGSSDQFSGGIPFLPHATNVNIARVMFGGGAPLCALMLIPASATCSSCCRRDPARTRAAPRKHPIIRPHTSAGP